MSMATAKLVHGAVEFKWLRRYGDLTLKPRQLKRWRVRLMRHERVPEAEAVKALPRMVSATVGLDCFAVRREAL